MVLLLLSTPGWANEPPEDPRLEQASALLGDDSQWDRALTLFAEVLRERPLEPTALTWSARVRAWQRDYDESLEYYAMLAGLDSPPPFAAVDISRSQRSTSYETHGGRLEIGREL